jgi:nitrate/nitrite-specific signal transduction histidine kinase
MSRTRVESSQVPASPIERSGILRTVTFNDALDALGTTDGARVTAKLGEFEKDWAHRPYEDLRQQWDLKPPRVDKSCKPNHLLQFRPTNDTRAWMAPDPHKEQNRMLLLLVIRKTSTAEENRIIKSLCKQLSRQRG